jgi:hypothetical protein
MARHGSKRLLHCMESPEHWFEDFGSARLTRGRATVKLDASARRGSVNYMVDHICEPILSTPFASSELRRPPQDGGKTPLTVSRSRLELARAEVDRVFGDGHAAAHRSLCVRSCMRRRAIGRRGSSPLGYRTSRPHYCPATLAWWRREVLCGRDGGDDSLCSAQNKACWRRGQHALILRV